MDGREETARGGGAWYGATPPPVFPTGGEATAFDHTDPRWDAVGNAAATAAPQSGFDVGPGSVGSGYRAGTGAEQSPSVAGAYGYPATAHDFSEGYGQGTATSAPTYGSHRGYAYYVSQGVYGTPEQVPSSAKPEPRRKRRWLSAALGILLALSAVANAVLGFVVVSNNAKRDLLRRELADTQGRLEEARDQLARLETEREQLLGAGAELLMRLDKAAELMTQIDSELEAAYSDVYSALEHLGRSFSLASQGYYSGAISELNAAEEALARFDSRVANYRRLRNEFRGLVEGLPV